MSAQQQVYRLICNTCKWQGERLAHESDKCPKCQTRLRLTTAESRGILRETIKRAVSPPAKPEKLQPISRVISDKEAPKDEGEWEFRLQDGVLTVIAWDDEKKEAKCVRLTRRGMDIYVMQKKEGEDDEPG